MSRPPESDVRTQIIETARNKFFRFGFNSVTTEEIASDLGISKKTLYRHFSSKESLLRTVVLTNLSEVELQFKGIVLDDTIDFVEKLTLLFRLVTAKLSRLERPFIRDMQKSVPHIWKEIQDFRREKIIKRFCSLFSSGIECGVFRNDIDPELMMLTFPRLIDSALMPEVVSQLPYSIQEVFETIVQVFFIGILTEDAKVKYIEQRETDKKRNNRERGI